MTETLIEKNEAIIKGLEEQMNNVKKHTATYKILKKIVPDLEAYYGRYNVDYKYIEWYSDSADNNWDEISCGGGSCGAYYARAIIIREGIRIYGTRIHIGSDCGGDNNWRNCYGIRPSDNWKKKIEKAFGEKAIPTVEKYLERNEPEYEDDDDEEDD